MMKNKITGRVEYCGKSMTFEGETDLPFKAVKLYDLVNPGSYANNVYDFFKDGLMFTPKNHFLIEESDFLVLSKKNQTRYKHGKDEGIELVNPSNVLCCYFVSNQFAATGDHENINCFIYHIEKMGFKVTLDKSIGTKLTHKSIRKAENSLVPKLGYDQDSFPIFYKEKIEDSDKVPGLVEYLNSEYERILCFAREIFKEKMEDFFKLIPVILSDELPCKEYENSDKNIARMLKFKIDRYGKKLSQEQILEILKNKTISIRILGEYVNDDLLSSLKYSNIENIVRANYPNGSPYIIIYYKNLYCSEWEIYKAYMSQVLSHEYMHYIHDMYVGNSVFEEYGLNNEAKNVSESIADYFAELYLIKTHEKYDECDKKLIISRARYNYWEHNFGSVNPYANALWYYYINGVWYDFTDDYDSKECHESINKFMDVLKESKKGLSLAFKELTK